MIPRYLWLAALSTVIAAPTLACDPSPRTPIGDVHDIVVVEDGLGPADQFCGEFAVSTQKVADFFTHAVLISGRQRHDWFYEGPCHARGTLQTPLDTWQWQLFSYGTALVTTASGDVFVLGDMRLAASPEEAGRGAVPDDLAEAVARFILTPASVDATPTCLIVAGADPSPALVERLRMHLPGLSPGTGCRLEGTRRNNRVVRRSDGAPARYLSLTLGEGSSADIARVEYAWDAGSWTGRGSTVDAERRGGVWHVSKTSEFEWVE